ncbi:MAG TPA: hypothetical protein VFU43_22715 [Streptosporangiaceae bacterium]|nr:hypothetical protein [Streptosporangiaceae bacterium]
MADDWVEAGVRELTRWAGEHDEDLDADGARLLLELAASDLELTAPGQLTGQRLRALLLDVFPEVVVASPDDVPGVLATSRTIVDFLDDAGVVSPAAAKELRVELDQLAPEFTELIAATDAADREVAADVLARMMREDSVDVTDEAAVERWIADFEALPEEERFARTARYLPEPADMTLPPVRPVPLDVAAGDARASGLLAQASALARWAGERPAPGGRLTAVDALAAVADLELSTPRWDRAAGPDARDIPEVERLWRAALASGLIVVAGERVEPGPGLETVAHGGDTAVLDVWLRAFDAAVTGTTGGQSGAAGLTPFEVVRRELPGVLIRLYEQEEPSTSAELFDALMDHVRLAYDVGAEDVWQTVGDYALTLDLEELAEWGVLAGTEDGYELTPLGVWGVRQLLLADGYTAPLVGELADRTADELVAALAWHRAATADEEIELWLAGRAPEKAAGDLVGVMAGGGPGVRNLAAAVLQRVDAAAEPVVRAALDEPITRPYALLWLADHGDTSVSPGPDELLWIFADTVAGMLETVEPAAAVAAAVADTPADFDLRAAVAQMWRLDHPDVADVLRALGDHHPDKEVAKAARKAAFKARSRPGAP